MLKSTMGKGFQMSFENGLTVSVQWGPGNYCKNHNAQYEQIQGRLMMLDGECENAEVAVWRTDSGRWLRAGDFLGDDDAMDDVLGWLSADQVVDLLVAVKNYDPSKT